MPKRTFQQLYPSYQTFYLKSRCHPDRYASYFYYLCHRSIASAGTANKMHTYILYIHINQQL